MNKKLLFTLPLLLNGCTAIYNAADSVGSHMPTIGEPCRNWQCITTSGQRTSEERKWLEEASEVPPTNKKANQQPTPPSAQ